MIDRFDWDLWTRLIQIVLKILGGTIDDFAIYLDNISVSYHK
jgi:hypothetical protein